MMGGECSLQSSPKLANQPGVVASAELITSRSHGSVSEQNISACRNGFRNKVVELSFPL